MISKPTKLNSRIQLLYDKVSNLHPPRKEKRKYKYQMFKQQIGDTTARGLQNDFLIKGKTVGYKHAWDLGNVT